MIKGVGVDIVDLRRFRQSVAKYGNIFIDRIFTPFEKSECQKFSDPVPEFALRFATKEAAYKALNASKKSRWHDFEIRTQNGGKNIQLHYYGLAKEAASNTESLVSWSLTEDIAISIVIAQEKTED